MRGAVQQGRHVPNSIAGRNKSKKKEDMLRQRYSEYHATLDNTIGWHVFIGKNPGEIRSHFQLHDMSMQCK